MTFIDRVAGNIKANLQVGLIILQVRRNRGGNGGQCGGWGAFYRSRQNKGFSPLDRHRTRIEKVASFRVYYFSFKRNLIMKLYFSAALFILLRGLTANAASILYDFENLPLGTVQSFTDSQGGIVATFTTTDTSGLGVYQNSGSFLPPPFMGRAVENGTGFPIIITFATTLQSASVDFGEDNLPFVSPLFTIKAYSGGVSGLLLATSTALGSYAFGNFPEGVATISAPGLLYFIKKSRGR
jgi:hypothetical protein